MSALKSRKKPDPRKIEADLRRRNAVLRALRLHDGPGLSFEELNVTVRSGISQLLAVLDALCAEGVITRTGRGHRGHPYLFSLPASGTEARAA
jgi:hypothetical protein